MSIIITIFLSIQFRSLFGLGPFDPDSCITLQAKIVADDFIKSEEFSEVLNRLMGASRDAAKKLATELQNELKQLKTSDTKQMIGLPVLPGLKGKVIDPQINAARKFVQQKMQQSKDFVQKYFPNEKGQAVILFAGVALTVYDLYHYPELDKQMITFQEKLKEIWEQSMGPLLEGISIDLEIVAEDRTTLKEMSNELQDLRDAAILNKYKHSGMTLAFGAWGLRCMAGGGNFVSCLTSLGISGANMVMAVKDWDRVNALSELYLVLTESRECIAYLENQRIMEQKDAENDALRRKIEELEKMLEKTTL